MPVLYILCPVTEEPISTMIEIADIEILKQKPLIGFGFGCPHCGKLHQWDGKTGFFAEALNQIKALEKN